VPVEMLQVTARRPVRRRQQFPYPFRRSFSLFPKRATPSQRSRLSDYQIAADSDGADGCGIAGETLAIVGHTKG
jgi:hypothetical protein